MHCSLYQQQSAVPREELNCKAKDLSKLISRKQTPSKTEVAAADNSLLCDATEEKVRIDWKNNVILETVWTNSSCCMLQNYAQNRTFLFVIHLKEDFLGRKLLIYIHQFQSRIQFHSYNWQLGQESESGSV